LHLHAAHEAAVQAHDQASCATSKHDDQPSTLVCLVACLPQQLLCDPKRATTDIIAELQGAPDSPCFEQLLVKEDVREAVITRLQQVCTCLHQPCSHTAHCFVKYASVHLSTCLYPSTKAVYLEPWPACNLSMTLLSTLASKCRMLQAI
jgi:hypothetical protein